MAEETYSKKLTDPRWQKKRLKILERDEWKCHKCNDTETELHVHHIEYGKTLWDVPDKSLITLCAHCHKEIEDCKDKRFSKDTDFKDIKTYKITNWNINSRIMFVRYNKVLSMSIYDNDKYIIAFDIEESVFLGINKLIKKSK